MGHSKFNVITLTLILAFAIAGCGKKDSGGDGGGQTQVATVPTPAPVQVPVANSNCLPDDFNQFPNGYPNDYSYSEYYQYKGTWTPQNGWQHTYGTPDHFDHNVPNWGRFCRCPVGSVAVWDSPDQPRCIPVNQAMGIPGSTCSLTDLNSCGPYGICQMDFNSWQTGQGHCL